MTTTPSDTDLEKAREIVSRAWPSSTAAGLHEETIAEFAQALSELRAEMQGEIERLKGAYEKSYELGSQWRKRAEAAESALSQRAEEIAAKLIQSAQGHEHLKELASKAGDRESALVHSSNAAILRLEAQAIRTRYARQR